MMPRARARPRARQRAVEREEETSSSPALPLSFQLLPASAGCVPARWPSDCPSSLFILAAFYPSGMINGFMRRHRGIFHPAAPSFEPLSGPAHLPPPPPKLRVRVHPRLPARARVDEFSGFQFSSRQIIALRPTAWRLYGTDTHPSPSFPPPPSLSLFILLTYRLNIAAP